jgi:hypothetical protein
MANVNQTRPHCVNEMGKTQSKLLVTRHGRGTAWARHGMCESALKLLAPKFFSCSDTALNKHYCYHRYSAAQNREMLLQAQLFNCDDNQLQRINRIVGQKVLKHSGTDRELQTTRLTKLCNDIHPQSKPTLLLQRVSSPLCV